MAKKSKVSKKEESIVKDSKDKEMTVSKEFLEARKNLEASSIVKNGSLYKYPEFLEARKGDNNVKVYDAPIKDWGSNPWKLLHKDNLQSTYVLEIKGKGCLVKSNNAELEYLPDVKLKEVKNTQGEVIDRILI